MTRLFRIALIILLTQITNRAFSQSNNDPSDYNPHDLKITGYFQFQFQKAAQPGIASFAGSDFADDVDNRFLIRRGRFKFDRVDKYTNIVFQIDATQDGVQLRDGFIQLKDPFFKTFTLTAGQFTKPFGYILSYSSSDREFPERPRFYQTTMPSERDLGAMIGINPPKYKFLKYEFGVFNGAGTNARDYDKRKDISTSLKFNFDSLAGILDLGFGGSYYNGHVRQNTSTVFNSGTIGGNPGFIASTNDSFEGGYAKRRYKGVNLQLKYHGGWGTTSIKSEYVAGWQPGIAPSDDVTPARASRSFNDQPETDIYNRKFNGFFVWLVQEIPKTQLQVIANYDVYDANTFVKGPNIGSPLSNTTAADVRFENFGAGLVYYMTKQVKLVLYYDHPVNEQTALPEFADDIRDDVFTARLQYKF
jgi:hypothetical protein